MLRTHGELGYRQEQRFHLELGLLKMAHAQRLLPIEELLSAAGVTSAGGPRASGRADGGSRSKEDGIAGDGSSRIRFHLSRRIRRERAVEAPAFA